MPDYMLTIRYFINNFKHLLLLLSGDTEITLDLKRSSNIKFCHWNLKVSLVEAFITNNNFDLVVLGPLLFFIYINDLPDGLTTMCKISADDTLCFQK